MTGAVTFSCKSFPALTSDEKVTTPVGFSFHDAHWPILDACQ